MGVPCQASRTTVAEHHASRVLKWLKPHLGKIEVATGVVMILVGVMIYFNWLVYLNRYFTPFIRL